MELSKLVTELKTQRTALDEQRHKLDAAIEALERLKQVKNGNGAKTITEAVRQHLEASNEPEKSKDIADALVREGYHSKDMNNAVTAALHHLAKDRKAKWVSRGVWQKKG